MGPAFTGCGAYTRVFDEMGGIDLRLKTLHPSTATLSESFKPWGYEDGPYGYGRCFASAKQLDGYDGHDAVENPEGGLNLDVYGVRLVYEYFQWW